MADWYVRDLPKAASRQAAAADLAVCLKDLANQLAASGSRSKRVLYGHGSLKRLSPKGHVLDATAPQLLLPDGRLWHYHSRRTADGIYYDANLDHAKSKHGSIPLGGERFSFLGAVIRGHSFGYRHSDDDPTGYELGAISGQGGAVHFVNIGEALADVVSIVRG